MGNCLQKREAQGFNMTTTLEIKMSDDAVVSDSLPLPCSLLILPRAFEGV